MKHILRIDCDDLFDILSDFYDIPKDNIVLSYHDDGEVTYDLEFSTEKMKRLCQNKK